MIISFICRFIAEYNYKSSGDLHLQKQVGFGRWPSTLFGVFRNAPDPWSIGGLAIARSNPTRVSRWTWDQN